MDFRVFEVWWFWFVGFLVVLRFGCCGSFLFAVGVLEFTVFAISFRLGGAGCGVGSLGAFWFGGGVGLRRFLGISLRCGVGII